MRVRTARRVMLHGVGVIAPGSSSRDEFLANVWRGKSALEPSAELQGAFWVGRPRLDVARARAFLARRHPPAKVLQWTERTGESNKLAVACTVDALDGQPGLEQLVRDLDRRTHVVFGSGIPDTATTTRGYEELRKARRAWNQFWADRQRNDALAAHLDGRLELSDVPARPASEGDALFERADAQEAWDAFWAPRSDGLQRFHDELASLESAATPADGDVEATRISALIERAQAMDELLDRHGCPRPPWMAVRPDAIFNLPNVPSSLVSMMLGVHGPSYAATGACATFGLVLKQALDAIRRGEADAAIVGGVEAPPLPEIVSAFHGARLAPPGPPNVPLSGLRGTHISGGACVWILVAADVAAARGLADLGVELLGAGVANDADHIITPSRTGPLAAVEQALESSGVSPGDLDFWDMHATGTPGDHTEMVMLDAFLPRHVAVSARKGLFGHGMAAGGGWELTAQTLGPTWVDGRCVAPPGGVPEDTIHPAIRAMGRRIIADRPFSLPSPKDRFLCGKLSLGAGGVSSCVVTEVRRRG